MTELLMFPSGLAFRAEALKYVEPVFTVRKAVTLRVIAGPENPNAMDATIRIENSTVIDVEYHAYGDWPEFIACARESDACVLAADSNAISDSAFYMEALQAMDSSQSEEVMGQIVTDTRALHQYHAAWREATYAPTGASDDMVHNPLTMDSIGEHLPPEKWAVRIINRTARMAKRLREIGVLVNSVEENIHGVWPLIDFLNSKKIPYLHDEVTDIVRTTFPKVGVIYNSMPMAPTVAQTRANAAA